MKKTLITFLFICLSGIFLHVKAQENPTNKIHWMSFEKAVELNKKEPKKLFIDVYTEWCGWCKKMDASTFKDSSVIDYMNKHFYAVKLDAERKDTVVYNNHPFAYMPEYKANELAIALLNGQMGYPSFVFLAEDMSMLAPISGYQSVEQILKALRFYGDNIYKSKSWDEFKQ